MGPKILINFGCSDTMGRYKSSIFDCSNSSNQLRYGYGELRIWLKKKYTPLDPKIIISYET